MRLKRFFFPISLFISVLSAFVLARLIGDIPSVIYIFTQLGGIFFDLLKMLSVPFAFISVTSAVIKMGAKRIRHISFKFILLTVFMCLIGFSLGFSMTSYLEISPWSVSHVFVKEVTSPTILQFIRNCIPVNPLESMVKGNMLQVLTLSFFTGFGILFLSSKEKDKVSAVFDISQKICINIVKFIMYFAPVGVFGLLYPVISSSFSSVIVSYFQMIGIMIVGSIIYMSCCCIPLLYVFKVTHPLGFIKTVIVHDFIGAISAGATNYMAPRIANLKKNTDLNPDFIDFFIPITAVLIRIGSTICVGMYTVFAASIFHVSLSMEQIVIAAILTVIALMCAPGIIGGTLMDCAIVWLAVGIPIEAIAYIAGIDYVIDLLRTVLNIQGGEIITACMNRFSSDGAVFTSKESEVVTNE